MGSTTKTVERRISIHISKRHLSRNRRSLWVQELYSLGLRPDYVVLGRTRSARVAKQIESKQIRRYRAVFGELLLNTRDDALDGYPKGYYTHSVEVRSRISQGLMGHLVSEETKRKISIAKRGTRKNSEGRFVQVFTKSK